MKEFKMEDVVQKQLEAYNQRNLAKFCDCYHSEIECMRLISNTITCRGIDEFRKIYENLFKDSPALHCELKSRIILLDSVIDEEFVTGVEKYPHGLHTVAIYGFREGLIDKVWFARK